MRRLRRGPIIGLVLVGIASALGAGWRPTTAAGAGNHYNEVEQTPHNIMAPTSSYTLKELCMACHVDGKIYLPSLPPPPPEETALPTFLTEQEQLPTWDRETLVKNFTLPQNWPLPVHLSSDQPFGTSADCLGCHDGTFASDVHRGHERMDKEGASPLSNFFDKFETALGTNPNRPSTIPDHPISTFYPRKPDGELVLGETTSSQRRFFSIADLQDDQLVMPTGPTSRFYLTTPGNPQAPRPNGANNSRLAAAAASSPNGASADATEPFRLIRTTFGIMHCDSCHNAHSELHAGFLRDKSPQLCLICHDR
jgi:predicted CXXCH cytochrome family protein